MNFSLYDSFLRLSFLTLMSEFECNSCAMCLCNSVTSKSWWEFEYFSSDSGISKNIFHRTKFFILLSKKKLCHRIFIPRWLWINLLTVTHLHFTDLHSMKSSSAVYKWSCRTTTHEWLIFTFDSAPNACVPFQRRSIGKKISVLNVCASRLSEQLRKHLWTISVEGKRTQNSFSLCY